jgi:hypothetical protein
LKSADNAAEFTGVGAAKDGCREVRLPHYGGPVGRARVVIEVELEVLDSGEALLHATSSPFEVWPGLVSPAGPHADLVQSPEEWADRRAGILDNVVAGGRRVLLGFSPGTYPLNDGRELRVMDCCMFTGHVLALCADDPLLEGLREEDFRYWASEEQARVVRLPQLAWPRGTGMPS